VARIKAIRRRLARAIEPLIAAIILIAITLVIAIAVAGWMMGVFTATTAEQERLIILPNATLRKSGDNGILNLSVRNIGTANITIIGVNVASVTCSASVPFDVTPGETKNITNANCVGLKPIPGATYTVKVFTARGNVFTTEVVAGTGT